MCTLSFLAKNTVRTQGWDRRTDGQTDRQTDRQLIRPGSQEKYCWEITTSSELLYWIEYLYHPLGLRNLKVSGILRLVVVNATNNISVGDIALVQTSYSPSLNSYIFPE